MTGSRTITGLLDLKNTALEVPFEAMNVPGRQGVEIHSLYSTKETGANGPAAALVRYLPGAKVKRHRHPGYELIFVLDGKLTNDGGTHGPGTLEILEPNSTHELHSEGGCTFLVVWEQPVQPIDQES